MKTLTLLSLSLPTLFALPIDRILIGNPYFVLSPNASGEVGIPDQSMLVINVTLSNGETVLRGYNAWQHTDLVISGPSLTSVVSARPLPKVTTTWDVEGAYQEGNFIHGLMHREHGWLYNGTYKYYGYVTYARSYDEGITFTPFPNTGNINDSIIIISEGPMNIGGSSNTGTGPQWAVERSDDKGNSWLYLYVQDAFARDPKTDQFVFAYTVARASLGHGESPLVWYKYYNNSWIEPGMGGRATSLPNLTGAKMIFVESLQVWLAVDYGGSLMTSIDGMIWNSIASGLSLFPVRPPAQPTSSFYQFSNILEYTSLIPSRGGNFLALDDSLWLFYCLVRATDKGGWNGGIRGLVAVELQITSSSNLGNNNESIPLFLVSLYQYRSKSNQSLWSSVWPVDTLYFTQVSFLANLLTSPSVAPPKTALIGLLDCVWVENGSHFIARLGECGTVNASNAFPPLEPPDGSILTPGFLAPLGWISEESNSYVPDGYKSITLWRCYTNFSFYSVTGSCATSDFNQTLLGYAYQHI